MHLKKFAPDIADLNHLVTYYFPISLLMDSWLVGQKLEIFRVDLRSMHT